MRKRVSRGDALARRCWLDGYGASAVVWLADVNAECTELDELGYHISNIRSPNHRLCPFINCLSSSLKGHVVSW